MTVIVLLLQAPTNNTKRKAAITTAVKFEATDYKKITLDEMLDFIEANYPNDKAWFKAVAFQDKGGNPVEKYNHLNAVRKFCEKYAPELLPVAKEKKVAPTERLKNW